MSNTTWRYGEIAARLSLLGYQPIPLIPESKQPAVAGWPAYVFNPSSPDEFSRPVRFAGKQIFPVFFTGIVTGAVVGLDVDVRDARIVRKLKGLAGRMLGCGPDRVGAPPKFLRVYRTLAPFGKIRSREFVLPGEKPRATGYKANAVEVLAKGQQFVAEAIHAKTGKPYRWSVPGGLLVTPVSSLTACTEAQFREYVATAEAILLEAGAKVRGKNPRSARSRSAPTLPALNLPAALRRRLERDAEAGAASVSALAAHDPAVCRAALAAIPNADLDYERWWRVGLACAAALGESGRRDFIAWSRKSRKHDQEREGYTDCAYSGFLKYCGAGRSRITAGSIFHLARKAGWTPRSVHGVSLRRWRRAFHATGSYTT